MLRNSYRLLRDRYSGQIVRSNTARLGLPDINSCSVEPVARQDSATGRTLQPQCRGAYSHDVAPERSLIRFAMAIYKDASPTGFESVSIRVFVYKHQLFAHLIIRTVVV